ncbi:MAG: DUF2974 domain-containing protein [Candidatus Electrothrix sp. AW2]|nr:DUF2974 domain-containing protein [Candidatus Electrothrix gigas]
MTNRIIWFLSLINLLFVSHAFALTAEEAHEAVPYAYLSADVYERLDDGTHYRTFADGSPDGSTYITNINSGTDDDEFDWGEGSLEKIWGIPTGVFSGFYARLYKATNSDLYVLAFRGTDIPSVQDVQIDIIQFFLGPENTIQYQQAINNTKTVLGRPGINRDNLILTGHSLGGGMAAYVAANLGLTAYIFNPARLGGYKDDAFNLADTYSIKSFISQKKDDSSRRDPISAFKWPLSINIDKDENFVPVEVSYWIGLREVNLHQIKILVNGLTEIASSYSEPISPPFPDIEEELTSTPIADQEPFYSTPGGEPMLQRVYNLTPSDTVTLYIENKESGEKFEASYSLDENGNWEDYYYPSSQKKKGTYEWYAMDQHGNSTNKVPYLIGDPESPDPRYGYPGSEIVDNTPVPECLPDFVAKRAWITKSENGEDKYVFEVGDTPWINVKVKNEGCADSPQDISVWYLLSKGEKEDGHHDWVKIGTDTIRDYELPVGQDKWEKEEFTVPDEPGKYNIVACADRIALYDNGHGDVYEEHKSNDCSTEAVFTVLSKNNPPVGYFDSATCTSFSGWAKDPDTTDPISVHFYADGPSGTGVFIGGISADLYRGDLPYGDKNHGFSFAFPDSLNDGVEHQVYAYAIDSEGGENPLLTNSPKTVKCGLTADQLVAVISLIENVILADDEEEKKGWLPAIFKLLLLN